MQMFRIKGTLRNAAGAIIVGGELRCGKIVPEGNGTVFFGPAGVAAGLKAAKRKFGEDWVFEAIDWELKK